MTRGNKRGIYNNSPVCWTHSLYIGVPDWNPGWETQSDCTAFSTCDSNTEHVGTGTRVNNSNLPSISSTVRSVTIASHHFCLVPGTLPAQSVMSILLSLVPRYMREVAMISGSHWRHSVVHRLKDIKSNFYLLIFERHLHSVQNLTSLKTSLRVQLAVKQAL